MPAAAAPVALRHGLVRRAREASPTVNTATSKPAATRSAVPAASGVVADGAEPCVTSRSCGFELPTSSAPGVPIEPGDKDRGGVGGGQACSAGGKNGLCHGRKGWGGGAMGGGRGGVGGRIGTGADGVGGGRGGGGDGIGGNGIGGGGGKAGGGGT